MSSTDNEHAKGVMFAISEAEHRALRTHVAQQGTTIRQVLRDAIANLTGYRPQASELAGGPTGYLGMENR